MLNGWWLGRLPSIPEYKYVTEQNEDGEFITTYTKVTPRGVCRLAYGDERVVVIGETHKVEPGKKYGLFGVHTRAFDTLYRDDKFGTYLYYCEFGGTVRKGITEISASERTYLYGGDVTDIFRKLAIENAIEALPLYRNVPQATIDYLETSDEILRPSALEQWMAANCEEMPGSIGWALSNCPHRAYVMSSYINALKADKSLDPYKERFDAEFREKFSLGAQSS